MCMNKIQARRVCVCVKVLVDGVRDCKSWARTQSEQNTS